jgi:general secretion pathway protein B
MSYILDALRKSDQQRQHGKAPTLLSAQSMPPLSDNPRQRFNTWIAAALIGLGILIGWLRPWQTQTTTAPVTRQMQSATPAVAPQAPAPAPLAQVPAALPIIVSAVPEPEQPARKSHASSPPESTAQITISEAEAHSNAVMLEQHIVKKDELPLAVRQSLPDIAIAFHQYSNNPGERRVMINNIVLRQGDWVAPGLKLEQITAQGVVLSSQGIQFLHSLK